MPRFLVVIVLTGAFPAVTPIRAKAQDRFPLSFDVNIGWGTGRTDGEFVGNPNGLTGDVLLALRLAPALGGSLVTATSLSFHGAGSSAPVIICRPMGGCVGERSFPDFRLIAVLAGIENRAGTLRILAGPAYVSMLRDPPTAAGIVARVDGALPIWGPIALAASLRAAAVPEIDGEAFQLYALGFGLRLR